jgi:hypothetical protein
VLKSNLARQLKKAAKACCLDASKELHLKAGKPAGGVIDAVVTVDGTWQKRGCTSLFGVVVVISWLMRASLS